MEFTPINLDSAPLEIIEKDFAGLYSGELGLSSIDGGQTAANRALAELEITGYAQMRTSCKKQRRDRYETS